MVRVRCILLVCMHSCIGGGKGAGGGGGGEAPGAEAMQTNVNCQHVALWFNSSILSTSMFNVTIMM